MGLLGLVVPPAYASHTTAGAASPEPAGPGRDPGRSLGWGDGPSYAGRRTYRAGGRGLIARGWAGRHSDGGVEWGGKGCCLLGEMAVSAALRTWSLLPVSPREKLTSSSQLPEMGHTEPSCLTPLFKKPWQTAFPHARGPSRLSRWGETERRS